MSTVKTVNLQHPNSSNINMVLGADGSVSGGLPSPNRNLLYNGAMQVAQRGTSSTGITAGGIYTADRWYLYPNSLGTWTQTVENDAPTGSGLRKSVKMLCTTADTSPAAGDEFQFSQYLEGQDLQRIAKGTSSAQQLTVSFWVKANVTGTYVVELRDADNSRSCSNQYTISSSATWEKKTLVFASDATGVLDNDNSRSVDLNFWLAAGSNFTSGSLGTTWASTTNANRAVSQTNLAASTNNYWQITGVQLEVGPAPTPFEFKPYAQELRECQRYYELVGIAIATSSPAVAANVLAYSSFAVTKRITGGTPTRITNDYFYGASGMSTTTSSYIVRPEGIAAYRTSSGSAGQTQFSELVAVSAEL
jgi:hypothetical protein